MVSPRCLVVWAVFESWCRGRHSLRKYGIASREKSSPWRRMAWGGRRRSRKGLCAGGNACARTERELRARGKGKGVARGGSCVEKEEGTGGQPESSAYNSSEEAGGKWRKGKEEGAPGVRRGGLPPRDSALLSRLPASIRRLPSASLRRTMILLPSVTPPVPSAHPHLQPPLGPLVRVPPWLCSALHLPLIVAYVLCSAPSSPLCRLCALLCSFLSTLSSMCSALLFPLLFVACVLSALLLR
jgi:hypothetical protein